MKKSIQIILLVLIVIIIFVAGCYIYVEMRFNKAFSEYGMQQSCCSCPGKEMLDVCCDCKSPETFLEKIHYIVELKNRG